VEIDRRVPASPLIQFRTWVCAVCAGLRNQTWGGWGGSMIYHIL